MPNFDRNLINLAQRPRALLFTLFATTILFLGVSGVFQPVETLPQAFRDRIRNVDSSGGVILVAIDNKSLSVGDAHPWPRSNFAKILSAVDAAGAKQIALDIDLSDATTDAEDTALAHAINTAKNKIYLQHRFSFDNGSEIANFYPLATFSKNAQLMNSNVSVDYSGSVVNAPYAVKAQGMLIPSLASIISGNYQLSEEIFPISYGIDLSTIPIISAVDILDGRWAPELVRGKTVLISGTASKEFPAFNIPGHGTRPKSIINIAAAETLINGRPIQLGFLPVYIFGVIAGACFLWAQNRLFSRLAGISFLTIVLAVPYALDSANIRVAIIPGILVFLSSCALRWLVAMKEHISSMSKTDSLSGLPNLKALEEIAANEITGLIAFKCHNITEVEHNLSDRSSEFYNAVKRAMELQSADTFYGGQGVVIGALRGVIGSKLDESAEGLHAMLRTIYVDGNPIDLIGTIGISDNEDCSILDRARQAIIASGTARNNERSVMRFSQNLSMGVGDDLSLISRLEMAISNNQCTMNFQPKVRLSDSSLIGGEMLLRWTDPDDGPMNIQELILQAEKHDRVWDLTKFGLTETAKFLTQLGQEHENLVISINLSAKLLLRADLVDRIIEIIDVYGISPSRIMLEITETAAISTGDIALQVLKRIQNAGFKLSIDDYGTGATSMEYLKKVPASELKIDRSFVANIAESRSDFVLVSSTIALAKSLGMDVIAEGIESKEIVELLRSLDCYGGQGYYFAKPMGLDAAVNFITGDKLRISGASAVRTRK